MTTDAITHLPCAARPIGQRPGQHRPPRFKGSGTHTTAFSGRPVVSSSQDQPAPDTGTDPPRISSSMNDGPSDASITPMDHPRPKSMVRE